MPGCPPFPSRAGPHGPGVGAGRGVRRGTRPALRSRSYPMSMPGPNQDPLLGLGPFTAPTDKGGVEPGLYVYLEQTRAIQAGVFNAP